MQHHSMQHHSMQHHTVHHHSMQYDTRATRHYATRHHATRHMLTATLTRARTHTQTQVALNSEDWSASEQRHRQGEVVTYEAGSVVGQVGEACLNSTSFLHHPHRVVAATPCLSFFLSLSPTLSRSIFLSCCVCAREGCVCARETRLRRYSPSPSTSRIALHCIASIQDPSPSTSCYPPNLQVDRHRDICGYLLPSMRHTRKKHT